MQILPTLLWPATIFILLAVTLNYFVIKSDLTNIKKLISGFVNILMLITTSFMFTLMAVSSFKETVAFLKLNQVLLFVVFELISKPDSRHNAFLHLSFPEISVTE